MYNIDFLSFSSQYSLLYFGLGKGNFGLSCIVVNGIMVFTISIKVLTLGFYYGCLLICFFLLGFISQTLLRKYLPKSFIHYNTELDIISRHNWFIMFYGEHVYAVHGCNRNWDIIERHHIPITFLALLSLMLSQLFSVWMRVLNIFNDGVLISLFVTRSLTIMQNQFLTIT